MKKNKGRGFIIDYRLNARKFLRIMTVWTEGANQIAKQLKTQLCQGTLSKLFRIAGQREDPKTFSRF
jgi:hypothetical protein